MDTAKVLWSGHSQAVRLSEEYRFDTDRVRIRRHGASVVLEPISSDWAWLDALVGSLDDDFGDAALDRPSAKEHPEIEFPGRQARVLEFITGKQTRVSNFRSNELNCL